MPLAFRSCCAAALLLLIATESLGEVTTAQVNAAIERGVAFLEKQQRPEGRWTDPESERGGATALCGLALLCCGRTADDPSVGKALDYLNRLPDPERTYSASLMLMALAQADPKKHFERIER